MSKKKDAQVADQTTPVGDLTKIEVKNLGPQAVRIKAGHPLTADLLKPGEKVELVVDGGLNFETYNEAEADAYKEGQAGGENPYPDGDDRHDKFEAGKNATPAAE